ncbi:hypothetical protein F4782DRAFT_326426 [Xylaria castorea]|nr:hypothetical protein F4782DRAFT_326426 [Xylaria castorea]
MQRGNLAAAWPTLATAVGTWWEQLWERCGNAVETLWDPRAWRIRPLWTLMEIVSFSEQPLKFVNSAACFRAGSSPTCDLPAPCQPCPLSQSHRGPMLGALRSP